MIIPARYKCDKCGIETEGSVQFWVLEVRVQAFAHQSVATYDRLAINKNGELKMHVCRPCLELYGIYVQDKEKEKVTTYPTIEQMIIEILEACGVYPNGGQQ